MAAPLSGRLRGFGKLQQVGCRQAELATDFAETTLRYLLSAVSLDGEVGELIS
jgi:hypothetical protein